VPEVPEEALEARRPSRLRAAVDVHLREQEMHGVLLPGREDESAVSVFIIKSSEIGKCPKHSPSPGHYILGGGCKCPLPEGDLEGLTLRKKQARAVALFDCPACDAPAGSPCGHLNSTRTRTRKPLLRPHPERVQLVDPSLAGYRKRAFRSSAEGKNRSMKRRGTKNKGWSENEG
jgi:hypothetical protein